jgi:hypothetical protein
MIVKLVVLAVVPNLTYKEAVLSLKMEAPSLLALELSNVTLEALPETFDKVAVPA